MATKTPQGILNNNLTNIKKNMLSAWMGEEPNPKSNFCRFVSRKFGYRATFLILHSYINKHGLRTLKDCIERWAPPTENHTYLYLRFVSNKSGYPEMVTVDLSDEDMMCRIVQAMVQMEVGIVENMDTIRQGYRLAACSINMKNKYIKEK